MFGPPGTGKTITVVEAILQVLLRVIERLRLVFTSKSDSEAQSEAQSVIICENQTDEVESRVSDSAYDSVGYDLVKTRLSESQAKRKHSEGLRTSIVTGLFFHFCLQLRQTSFHWIISEGVISRIGTKSKCSDSSDSNSVEPYYAYDSDFQFSLDRKPSYDFDYDSYPVASNMQPLAKCDQYDL